MMTAESSTICLRRQKQRSEIWTRASMNWARLHSRIEPRKVYRQVPSSRTGAEKQGFTTTIRSRAQNRSRGVDAALDFLAPHINYSPCHDVAQLYSVRLHSGDMAHIRDTAPVICRGFVIFDVRNAKKPQRRAPPPGSHATAENWPRSHAGERGSRPTGVAPH